MFTLTVTTLKEPHGCEAVGRDGWGDQFAAHELRGLRVGDARKSTQRSWCYQQGVKSLYCTQIQLRAFFSATSSTSFSGEMLTNWHPLLSRGEVLKLIFIRLHLHLIPVGAEPEQTILCDQRAAEFDSQDDLGRALCLGEMGQDRIGRNLLNIL